MGIRIAFISFLLGIILTGSLHAQPNNYGVPMITNYSHYITGGSEQNWCVTQDARGIMYFGNNNKGVLEYDGEEWRSISIPNDPIVRSLVAGGDGIIYVGAFSEFGYLSPDNLGNMKYHSLSDTIDQEEYPFSDVWRTYSWDENIYFCSISKIFIYNTRNDELSIRETSEFTWLSFIIDGTLYVSDYGQGLMKYENENYVVVNGGEFFKEMTITGLVKYDENKLLVGTYYMGIYLFDLSTGTVDHSFLDPELQDHFKKGTIVTVQPVRNHFAVSSLFNGLVIIDREGNATDIVSKSVGLIADDITYSYTNDQIKGSSPLWITSWMGVSKLEIDNPFKQFTEASGFEGFISDIAVFDGKLFVSTFSGLFYKTSTPTSTKFVAVPQIRDGSVHHLHVFNPSPNVSLLLASSENETFVIDRNMNVSTLEYLVINPPPGLVEREQYGGQHLIQDPKHSDIIYTGETQVVGLKYVRGKFREIMRTSYFPDNMQKIVIDKYGYFWTSTARTVLRIDITNINNATTRSFSEEDGLPAIEKNQVFIDPDSEEILIGTVDGFYRYNYFRNTIYRDTIYNAILPPGNNHIMAFIKDPDGDYWYSFENEYTGWNELVAQKQESKMAIKSEKPFQRLPNTSTDVFFSDPDRGVWIGKSNELYHFDKAYIRDDSISFQVLIRKVTLDSDSLLFNGTNFRKDENGKFIVKLAQSEETQPLIKHRYNNIEFNWAAPYFEQEEELQYSYKLDGFDEKWSEWDMAAYKDFTNLPFGDYTIGVKALNVYGDVSEQASYSFTILRPWYATYVAIAGYILLAGLLVYIIIKLYTRRLKQENIRLEGIIEERTAEIRKQKEELTDSIEYASRIQRALLPPDKLMHDNSLDHFILFRPRDIVSGDFYWMGLKNGKLIIVAADCTGHGVPGAFMSMLGMTFLDEIVIKAEITDTDEILAQLRQQVITSLRQSSKSIEESTKDGMDLAMVSIDIETHEIQYSGAYNPLYLVRKLKRSEKAKLNKGEELDLPRGSIHDDKNLLIQIRADQMPIGISEKTSRFTATSIKDEGYNIYMFSDGFLDQFGGPQGKKFMSKNFKKLILELQSVPMNEQGAALEKVLLGWMGEISQIDDILVMGLRMSEH